MPRTEDAAQAKHALAVARLRITSGQRLLLAAALARLGGLELGRLGLG